MIFPFVAEVRVAVVALLQLLWLVILIFFFWQKCAVYLQFDALNFINKRRKKLRDTLLLWMDDWKQCVEVENHRWKQLCIDVFKTSSNIDVLWRLSIFLSHH